MKFDPTQQQSIEQDGRYQDIGNLPSNFYPYSYKKLLIRPFTVKELRLVGKAGLTGEERHLIRAIDLVINQPIDEIALGDYYYILLWLKIHSSPKTPYILDWKCPEKIWKHKTSGHIILNDESYAPPSGADASMYELAACGHENREAIHQTSVEIFQLPEGDESEPLGEHFDFPRVKHLDEIKSMLKDDELRVIVPGAQWIKGETMLDKVAYLEAQPDASLFMESLTLNTATNYGIAESCVLRCSQCRAKFTYNLELDPQSFFR